MAAVGAYYVDRHVEIADGAWAVGSAHERGPNERDRAAVGGEARGGVGDRATLARVVARVGQTALTAAGGLHQPDVGGRACCEHDLTSVRRERRQVGTAAP